MLVEQHNKLTCRAESALLKNLTLHSVVIIHKIYSVNSGFVTGWHYIYIYIYIYIIQIYSGITCGRVLNGELYTCKLYKLISLCWSTRLFREVTLHSSGHLGKCPEE